MSNANAALAAMRTAVDELIATAETCRDRWSAPRAPGKWSPAQVVEHVARALEAAASDMHGARSGLPNLPAPARFLARRVLLRRVLSTGHFPKARTNAAMNPTHGPESPADGATRMDRAWIAFRNACEQAVARGTATSRVFGTVPLQDYVRFQELHTAHHCRQLSER